MRHRNLCREALLCKCKQDVPRYDGSGRRFMPRAGASVADIVKNRPDSCMGGQFLSCGMQRFCTKRLADEEGTLRLLT